MRTMMNRDLVFILWKKTWFTCCISLVFRWKMASFDGKMLESLTLPAI